MPLRIKIAVADSQTLFRDCFVKSLNSSDKMKVLLETSNGKDLIEKISISVAVQK